MKILILSDACFNDNVFPMFRAMFDKGLDVTCLINLTTLKAQLINIENRLPQQAIIKATEYQELRKYDGFLDLNRIYLVNHLADKKHPWISLSSAVAIWSFIKKGDYDIIHCDFPLQGAKTLLYWFRKKFVLIQHDPFPHSGHKYPRSYRLALKLAYIFIPKFVILNNSHYEKYCEEYNLAKERVYVNRLGPLECINLFAKDGVPERNHNVLFFGRIAQYKGVEFLCEAMTKVHEVIPDATCTIAGSGKFYFDIEPYRNLSYFEIINRFIEEEELAKYIQQCTISVCAYTDATQSGGILTSFAMNKPVVASDLDTLKEMVTDGYNCLIVPPRDSTALAEAIIRLLQDETLRNQIKNNILEDGTHGKLSWSSIVDKYIEIYKA